MDWRLMVDQTDLKGKKLYEIHFPEFWERSFELKNAFFQMIKADAEDFVKTYCRGEEYLEGKKIGEFWHSHCEFCTQKITTHSKDAVYCTEDFLFWIYADCFQDFKEDFSWRTENSLEEK